MDAKARKLARLQKQLGASSAGSIGYGASTGANAAGCGGDGFIAKVLASASGPSPTTAKAATTAKQAGAAARAREPPTAQAPVKSRPVPQEE